jgi:hypothetical protein
MKRNRIIQEIHYIANNRGITTDQAVNVLEDERKATNRGCSLDKLSKIIKDRAGARATPAMN